MKVENLSALWYNDFTTKTKYSQKGKRFS